MTMPNTLAATRGALQALLAAVPAVGVVHPCERFADGEEGFKRAYLYTHTDPAADAFGADPHIRGWYMRRTATTELNTNGRILNEHTWLVRGYMAFRDAISSELIFDDLVERMREAVRLAGNLGLPGLLGASLAEERGVQVTSAGPVYFAGVLCHSAALGLKTRNWAEWRKP
ncbi:MAG: hypothetical protein QM569_14890 [Acidovorax sp.]|uniref:hypothetical protein n=1 Tax=Acidovorax sp. TaxID=1872122 RepID=UPI0039E5BB61